MNGKKLVIPIQLRKTSRGRVIVRRENTQAVQNQIPLLKAIANGIQWQQYLDDGLFKSVQEFAKHLGKERAVVSHTLQLAQLSPEIIHLALI
jgi:ParB-like chromosome segregation protein Spo0J